MQEIQRKRLLKTPFGCKICRKGPPNGPQSMPEGWKMDPQIPCPIGNHFHGVWGTLLAKPSWNEPKTLESYFSVLPERTGSAFGDLVLISVTGMLTKVVQQDNPLYWSSLNQDTTLPMKFNCICLVALPCDDLCLSRGSSIEWLWLPWPGVWPQWPDLSRPSGGPNEPWPDPTLHQWEVPQALGLQ